MKLISHSALLEDVAEEGCAALCSYGAGLNKQTPQRWPLGCHITHIL